jgi:hypothetical protein
MTDFIEQRIIEAVKKLLTGCVNEILQDAQFPIPIVEFESNSSGFVSVPVIALSGCERTEKERIIRLDAYSLTLTFSFIEQVECELHCYAYSGAVSRAFYDDPTLGGIVDRAVITGKKYISPKKLHCGEGYALIVTVRVTVENPPPCGFST